MKLNKSKEKYVDAKKLKALLHGRYKQLKKKYDNTASTYYEGGMDALDLFDSVIDALSQEKQEIDLDKEFTNWWLQEKDRDWSAEVFYTHYRKEAKKLVRHFLELSKTAIKQE